jgi:SpoIID/LytB domain protein
MEALRAQAVVARSYAADRFLQNWERSWQLHWHYTVDMAYPGWSPDAGRARDAIQTTHGELLMYAGQPLPALFHASSGGRTASIEEIKPGLTLADGHTDPAPALAPVDDPAAKDGAKALNLSKSHWQWSASFPLDQVENEVKTWLSSRPNRGAIGVLKAVKIIDRHEPSGRVATVAIVSRVNGKDETLRLPANEFRMAIGPVDLKSTLWTRCEVRKKRLVIEGRGFGHGVGLSQVSAWWLAKSGLNAEEILKRFYPQADIRRSW